MLELGISQAQTQFTKLLNKSVTIIDKKSKNKKAVILPYKQYEELIARANINRSLDDGLFSKFIGILDDEFQTNDTKYTEIIK